MFAEIAIGEGRVYLNDEFPEWVYSLRWRRRAQRLPCICLWHADPPPTSVRRRWLQSDYGAWRPILGDRYGHRRRSVWDTLVDWGADSQD